MSIRFCCTQQYLDCHKLFQPASALLKGTMPRGGQRLIKAGHACICVFADADSVLPDGGMVFDHGYGKRVVDIDGDNLAILEAQQKSFPASWSPNDLDVPACASQCCHAQTHLHHLTANINEYHVN